MVSLNGLDLSFLKSPKSKKAAQKMRKDAEKERKSRSLLPPARSDLFGGGAGFLLPDLNVAYNGGFVSPIDGQFISSRAQLREHNKRHGVMQTGDIRGERARDLVKKKMHFDPTARGTSEAFSWGNPSR